MTSTLAAFRGVGGAISDARWRELWGETASLQARSPAFAAQDPLSLPDPATLTRVQAGSGGKFATKVVVAVRDADTGDLMRSFYTHMTSEPHTPADAAAAAMDLYSQDENAQKYGQTIEGAMPFDGFFTEPYEGAA